MPDHQHATYHLNELAPLRLEHPEKEDRHSHSFDSVKTVATSTKDDLIERDAEIRQDL